MVLSEEKDTAKLKSGLVAVAVLLVLGALSPAIIEQFTGVNLSDLTCEEETTNSGGTTTTKSEACLEDGEFKTAIFEALSYVSLIVALVGFAGLIIVGVRY